MSKLVKTLAPSDLEELFLAQADASDSSVLANEDEVRDAYDALESGKDPGVPIEEIAFRYGIVLPTTRRAA